MTNDFAYCECCGKFTTIAQQIVFQHYCSQECQDEHFEMLSEEHFILDCDQDS